jgi:hypothetical protein
MIPVGDAVRTQLLPVALGVAPYLVIGASARALCDSGRL